MVISSICKICKLHRVCNGCFWGSAAEKFKNKLNGKYNFLHAFSYRNKIYFGNMFLFYTSLKCFCNSENLEYIHIYIKIASVFLNKMKSNCWFLYSTFLFFIKRRIKPKSEPTMSNWIKWEVMLFVCLAAFEMVCVFNLSCSDSVWWT